MRTQQQAERAEQQRIKSLVLNYDLSNDDAQDGESTFSYPLQPDTNRSGARAPSGGMRANTARKAKDRQDFNNPPTGV